MEAPHDKIDGRAAIAGLVTLALVLGMEGLFVAASLDRHAAAQSPPEWSDSLIRSVASPKYQ